MASASSASTFHIILQRNSSGDLLWLGVGVAERFHSNLHAYFQSQKLRSVFIDQNHLRTSKTDSDKSIKKSSATFFSMPLRDAVRRFCRLRRWDPTTFSRGAFFVGGENVGRFGGGEISAVTFRGCAHFGRYLLLLSDRRYVSMNNKAYYFFVLLALFLPFSFFFAMGFFSVFVFLLILCFRGFFVFCFENQNFVGAFPTFSSCDKGFAYCFCLTFPCRFFFCMQFVCLRVCLFVCLV